MEPIIDLRKQEPAQEPARRSEIISWTGFLYYHEPDLKAVWIAAVFFICLAAVLQYFQKNLTTTTLMALIGFMILFQAKRKHNNIGEVVISPIGIKIGNVLHPYTGIKSFWVDYIPEQGIEELSIQSKKWYLPYIRLPITSQDPVRIRSFLIQYIPEVQHELSLGEVIARRLGL